VVGYRHTPRLPAHDPTIGHGGKRLLRNRIQAHPAVTRPTESRGEGLAFSTDPAAFDTAVGTLTA